LPGTRWSRRNSEEVEKMKEEMSEAMKQVKLREEKLRAREKDLMEELHEKEEALRTSQLQLNQSAQGSGMVESVMAHADQKHGELMQGQRFQHQMEMETMQNQLLWMMAVVGEDKISQVLNDPQQHAESMRKALEIKQGMMQTQGPLPEQEG